MKEITFCFYELKNGMQIYKNENNFIMFNPKSNLFLLFEIKNGVNVFVTQFGFDDIKFNF